MISDPEQGEYVRDKCKLMISDKVEEISRPVFRIFD